MLDTPRPTPQASDASAAAAALPADAAPPFADRLLTAADIPELTAMEREACMHPMHAWSDENYSSSLRAGYWARVRCDAVTGRILAICVAMDGVDEVHLLNIAVARDQHGRGHARALLHELFERCRQRRAEALWLEVRPSNQRARALYLREGFEDIGVRKHYYPAATASGREDAVVMRRLIALGEESEACRALD